MAQSSDLPHEHPLATCMAEPQRRSLMDPPEVERVLARMAGEIVQRTGGGGGLLLVGIERRGVQLARRIADAIEAAVDTEALAVFPDGRMLVVTKGRSGPVTIFAFPRPLSEADIMMLAPVATLSPGLVQLPEMATGALA